MIKFNNIVIPAFVRVNEIKKPILPPVSQNTVKVHGKAGVIDYGNEIDARQIEVTISILADSPSDLRNKTRQLANWLYYDEAKPLVFLNEPSLTYMAKVTGTINIDEIVKHGQGSFTFFLADPYAYGQEKVYDLTPTNPDTPLNYVNTGDVEAYPKMIFDFTQNTTDFHIISANKRMSFGQQQEFGQTVVDPMPFVMRDDCDNLSLWTQSNSVHDGEITGNFWTNGYSFLVTDFGEGTGWHGASMQRSIPRLLDDFRVTMNLALVPQSAGDLGRVLMTLLDQNNNRIATISIRNGTIGGIRPYMEAFVGYTPIISGKGTYGTTLDYMHPFYGDMFIDRRGNSWHFRWQQFNPDTREGGRVWDEFYVNLDEAGIPTNKLASIQIAIMRAGEHPVIPLGYMYIGNIAVQEVINVQDDEDPYVFHAGDRLEINSETGEIKLNGVDNYTTLNPISDDIILEKGNNAIITSPHNVATGLIKWRERYY